MTEVDTRTQELAELVDKAKLTRLSEFPDLVVSVGDDREKLSILMEAAKRKRDGFVSEKGLIATDVAAKDLSAMDKDDNLTMMIEKYNAIIGQIEKKIATLPRSEKQEFDELLGMNQEQFATEFLTLKRANAAQAEEINRLRQLVGETQKKQEELDQEPERSWLSEKAYDAGEAIGNVWALGAALRWLDNVVIKKGLSGMYLEPRFSSDTKLRKEERKKNKEQEKEVKGMLEKVDKKINWDKLIVNALDDEKKGDMTANQLSQLKAMAVFVSRVTGEAKYPDANGLTLDQLGLDILNKLTTELAVGDENVKGYCQRRLENLKKIYPEFFVGGGSTSQKAEEEKPADPAQPLKKEDVSKASDGSPIEDNSSPVDFSDLI